MHGKKDFWVPWSQSDVLHKALLGHHIASELVLFDNADHGHLSTDVFYSFKNVNRVLEFFDRYLLADGGMKTELKK